MTLMKFTCKILLVLSILIRFAASTGQAQTVPVLYNKVMNIYETAVFQWYDMYAEGVMMKAQPAGKLLDSAKILMERRMNAEAGKLIHQAEELLKYRDKTFLKHYLQQPEAGGRPLTATTDATVNDYTAMERFGVGLWDIAGSFMGRGDDGNSYLIMPLIYYKNTSSIIPPVLCEIITSEGPSEKRLIVVKTVQRVIQTADSLRIEASNGETRVIYTVRHVQGSKIVSCSGSAPGISFSYTLTPGFTYWFNRNQSYAVPYPGTLVAGFEEPGAASGTITRNGKTVTIGHAAGVSECFYNGPQPGYQLTEFRKVIETYGNEWYIPFHSPDVSGIFLVYGEFRDAVLMIGGKQISPERFTIKPVTANRSLRIEAWTPEGLLILNFDCSIRDKQFSEYSGTLTGSLKGKPIQSGSFLLEHTLMKGIP